MQHADRAGAAPLRLLVLSSNQARGHVNDVIHRGFFDAFPGEVIWYGPGEAGFSFDPERPLHLVCEDVRPDLVLVNMKKRVVSWLDPKWVRTLEVPRACVEVDFCFEKDASWYESCRFDMTFFRGWVDWRRAALKKKHWLPFSVDPAWIGIPEDDSFRTVDVGFVGTRNPLDNYPVRNRAIAALAGYVTVGRARGEQYPRWFWRCRMGLTCSSKWRYENAKHVIIPAAGALLLTDGTPGLASLLSPSAYEIYEPDGSNLLAIVERLLSDPEDLLARRKIAAETVRDNHTHARRWAELLEIMGVKRG